MESNKQEQTHSKQYEDHTNMLPTLHPVVNNRVVIDVNHVNHGHQKRGGRRQHSYYCNAIKQAKNERKREILEKEREELAKHMADVSWVKREEIYSEIYGQSLLLNNDKRLLK